MALIRPSLLPEASLVLRDGGVVLRPPRTGDFDSWADLREMSRAQLAPYEPQWTLDELYRSSFRERLKRYQRDAKNDLGYAFLAFQAIGAHELVGGITLSNVRRGVAQAAAVGYWIGLPHVRRGYASSALAAVTRFAFEELRLHRLEAACMPSNVPSLRTLQRGGYRREGIASRYLKINGLWEDHVLFGLTREDWAEGRRP